MSDHIPEEIHIRHSKLYEFRKGSKTRKPSKTFVVFMEMYWMSANVSVGLTNFGPAMLTSRMAIVREDRQSWTTTS
jgi:hypothetical protein